MEAASPLPLPLAVGDLRFTASVWDASAKRALSDGAVELLWEMGEERNEDSWTRPRHLHLVRRADVFDIDMLATITQEK